MNFVYHVILFNYKRVKEINPIIYFRHCFKMATSMVNKRAPDEKFSTAGPKKSKFSHIKEKAIMFLSSKENSNVLVELLEYTQVI